MRAYRLVRKPVKKPSFQETRELIKGICADADRIEKLARETRENLVRRRTVNAY